MSKQPFSKMPFDRKGRMFERFAKTMPVQQTYREIYQNAREAGATKFEISVVSDPNRKRWIKFLDNGPGMEIEAMAAVMTRLGESGHDGNENMGVGARLTAVTQFGEAIFVSKVEGESASSLHYGFDPEYGPVIFEYDGEHLYQTQEWEWQAKSKHGSAWLMPVPSNWVAPNGEELNESTIAARIAYSLRARYSSFDDCSVSQLTWAKTYNNFSQRTVLALVDYYDSIKTASGTLSPQTSWTIDWWVLDSPDKRTAEAGGKYMPSCIAVQTEGELFQHAPGLFVSGVKRSLYDKFGLNTKTARYQVSIIITPPKGMYKMTVDRSSIHDADGNPLDYSEMGLWFSQNMPNEVKDLIRLNFKTAENAEEEIMSGIHRDYLASLPKIKKIQFSNTGQFPGLADDITASSDDSNIGGTSGQPTGLGEATTGSDLNAETGLPDDDQRRRKGKQIKAHVKPSYVVVPEEEYDTEALGFKVPLYVEPSTGRCVINKDHDIFSDIVEAVCSGLSVGENVERREEISNEILNRAGIAAAIRFGVWSGLSRQYKMSATVRPSMFGKETFWGGALAGTNLVDEVMRKLRSS